MSLLTMRPLLPQLAGVRVQMQVAAVLGGPDEGEVRGRGGQPVQYVVHVDPCIGSRLRY